MTAPRSETTPRHPRAPGERDSHTRDRILEVAEGIIAHRGMEGMRLKDVAEGVGIQPPSIFAHFEGREAIGNAVAARVLEQLAELIERATDGIGDPEDAVRRGARAAAGHLYERPAHVRLLLRDLARSRSGASELAIASPIQRRIEARIRDLLTAGIAAGRFRAEGGEAFLPVVLGSILALVGWAGFDDDGHPASPFSRQQIEDHAEQVAAAWIRRSET